MTRCASCGARPALLVAVLSFAAVLAACSSSSATPQPSSAEPTATPLPTPSPSAIPTSVPPGEVAELHSGFLPPGTYTWPGFTPQITLELDDGWGAYNLLAGFFDVQQDAGTPDVIAVQFALPSSVSGADGGVAVATAQEAAEALAGNPSLAVIDGPLPVTVDGLAGIRLAVENVTTANASVMRVPPGPLAIARSRRLQLTFLDTPQGLLAILVGGSVARWDETLAISAPVVASVQIAR
jgi:hypothetical protein